MTIDVHNGVAFAGVRPMLPTKSIMMHRQTIYDYHRKQKLISRACMGRARARQACVARIGDDDVANIKVAQLYIYMRNIIT